jgi:ArsR family transcriptional regulator
MADIYEAIADPTRRQLLEVLLGAQLESGAGELTVSELVAATGLGQPTVSKHLKTLREVGLVAVREAGQKRFYTVTPEPLEEIEDWIVTFLSVGFDPEEDTADVVALFGTAGENLGRWLTDSAAWLGSRIKERVDVENMDPKDLGRKVGRKLAEARVEAEQTAKDFEKTARAKIEEVVDEVKSESKHLAKDAKQKAEEVVDTAKTKAEELADSAKAKAEAVKKKIKR